jgi:hypothetical protein
VSDPGSAGSGRRGEGPGGEASQGIATAIAEVSERATLLVREEIELAKAEVAEKAAKLAKGAVIGVAAGVFLVTALFFALLGCAWLLYYYLPIGNDYTYFWGFFAMALILVVLGLLAGLLAARAVKRGAPPTPDMAIAEARKIRDTVSSAPGAAAAATGPAAPTSPPAPPAPPVAASPAPYGAAAPTVAPAPTAAPATDTDQEVAG